MIWWNLVTRRTGKFKAKYIATMDVRLVASLLCICLWEEVPRLCRLIWRWWRRLMRRILHWAENAMTREASHKHRWIPLKIWFQLAHSRHVNNKLTSQMKTAVFEMRSRRTNSWKRTTSFPEFSPTERTLGTRLENGKDTATLITVVRSLWRLMSQMILRNIWKISSSISSSQPREQSHMSSQESWK